MPILGIDYGAKKIGLAISGSNDKVALPLKTLLSNNQSEVFEQLRLICQDNAVKKIIIGVPLSLSNGQKAFLRRQDLQNKQMQEVLNFVKVLRKNLSLPIELEDERLSTKLALRASKEFVKENGDDAIAAMLILQNYLDRVNY
ncbi:MAG: Holliday junction resolvase RuvX [Candidatus Magasanikbacteria bacterium]|nr:Holliday junction resolvase RuvX [Candidatus Magasanikbacteria bacterium]